MRKRTGIDLIDKLMMEEAVPVCAELCRTVYDNKTNDCGVTSDKACNGVFKLLILRGNDKPISDIWNTTD